MGEQQQSKCRDCGSELPPVKNWTRLSKWRRELPRRCRGCRGFKHGMSRSRLYHTWYSMLERCGHRKCANPAAERYYISKGIIVCLEWQDFPAFAAWANGNGYADNLTIDRIDSDGNYEPSNCRWVTMTENLRARKDRKLTMADAEEIRRLRSQGLSGAEVAKRYGVKRNHVYRVTRGERWA